MKKVNIQEARRFSTEGVNVEVLLEEGDLRSELLSFEAGQSLEPRSLEKSVVYQVLEGEAIVSAGGARDRLGKGRLLSIPGGTEHVLENAGGGLLVVLAHRAL